MKTNKPKIKQEELRVESRTENLAKVRDFINAAVSKVCASEDIIGNIVLAVDEAVTNIIKHAYKFSSDGEIIIKVKYSKETVEIEITDYGLPFSPESVPVPDLKKYFEEKRVGGLGIYLMKSLMDDVHYKRVNGKFNQVFLMKNLNASK